MQTKLLDRERQLVDTLRDAAARRRERRELARMDAIACYGLSLLAALFLGAMLYAYLLVS